jgi:sec-independent protein translocase protein TatC
MTKTKQKPPSRNRPTRTNQYRSRDEQQTFSEHLLELRLRLLYVALTVLVFSTAAYFVQQQLVRFLLMPAHHQNFIYTSPGGGLTFLFQVCIYVGITASIPVFVYQLLRFIEPVIGDSERRFIMRMGWFSAVLAVIGFGFGYLIGLPTALHFLGHQFTTKQIAPLLTIQEYMSFITVYLIGSAFIFQLPLIVLFINRIKPLRPRKLLGFEKYVIAGAFIVSILMAPTVNLVDQIMLAGPIIATYQVSILLVLLINRAKGSSKVAKLLEQDRLRQVARQQMASSTVPVETTNNFLPQFLQKDQVATTDNVSKSYPVKKPVKYFDIIKPSTRWSVPSRRTLIEVQFK